MEFRLALALRERSHLWFSQLRTLRMCLKLPLRALCPWKELLPTQPQSRPEQPNPYPHTQDRVRLVVPQLQEYPPRAPSNRKWARRHWGVSRCLRDYCPGPRLYLTSISLRATISRYTFFREQLAHVMRSVLEPVHATERSYRPLTTNRSPSSARNLSDALCTFTMEL
jgi:hypothetical protein